MRPPLPLFAGLLAEVSYEELGVTTVDLDVDGGVEDGITSKDGLVIAGGTIDVTAADDALCGKDHLVVLGGTTASVTTASVTSAGGGMGTRPDRGVAPGADEAAEGRDLEITGGTWYVNADGDGLDSNGTLTISGGTVVIDGPTTDREGALDASGGMELSGGTLAAAGSPGMLATPESTGDQGTLMIVFASALAEDSVITVTDSDGAHLASFATAKTAQALVLSTADIVVGEEYTVSVGGTVTGTGVVGLVTDGVASGGGEIGRFTAA